MNKMDKVKILEVIKYTIENKATINEICNEFNISRRTAQKYLNFDLNQITDESNLKEMKELLKKIKEDNEKKSLKDVNMIDVVLDMTNNLLTKEIAAKKYNISISKISKYIQSLDQNNEILINYKNSRKKLEKIGKIVGGLNSKRNPNNTDFEALEIAETMINNGLTIDEASIVFKQPRSTIYETLKRINDENILIQLDKLFYDNKRR